MRESEALLAVAGLAERDVRGPRAATQSLWGLLHREVDARPGADLRVAFDALGVSCNVSDVVAYLGNALRKMTAAERASALRAAAESLRTAENAR